MITHRIGRLLQAVGCPLVIVLAAALAAAQGPPDPPPGPPDQSAGPAAGRPDRGGPGWPYVQRRSGGQWQGRGQQFRTRAPLNPPRSDSNRAGSETRHLAERSPPAPSRNQSPTSRHVFRVAPDRVTDKAHLKVPIAENSAATANAHRMDHPPTSSRAASSNLRSIRRSAGLASRLLTDAAQLVATKVRRRFANSARDPALASTVLQAGSVLRPAIDAAIQTLVISAPTVPAMRMSIAVPLGRRPPRGPDGPGRDDMNRGPDGPRPENMDQRREGPRGENMNRGPDRPRRGGNRGFDNPGRGGPVVAASTGLPIVVLTVPEIAARTVPAIVARTVPAIAVLTVPAIAVLTVPEIVVLMVPAIAVLTITEPACTSRSASPVDPRPRRLPTPPAPSTGGPRLGVKGLSILGGHQPGRRTAPGSEDHLRPCCGARSPGRALSAGRRMDRWY